MLLVLGRSVASAIMSDELTKRLDRIRALIRAEQIWFDSLDREGRESSLERIMAEIVAVIELVRVGEI